MWCQSASSKATAKIYIIECKNWSGKLIKRNDKWVQLKRYGEEKEHNDVLKHNIMKKNVVLSALRNIGISILDTDCVQKVIFMNSGLKIDNAEIYNHPDIITREKLDEYLNNQKSQLDSHQRFFDSVISLILDNESSAKVIDGLFSRLGGKDHKKVVSFVNELPTWDTIKLYGTKILSGDIVRDNIYQSAYRVPFDKIKKIKVKIIRSENLLLANSLLKIGRPIGLNLYGSNGRILLKTKANPDGFVQFLLAGEGAEPISIPVLEIDEIIKGKNIP